MQSLKLTNMWKIWERFPLWILPVLISFIFFFPTEQIILPSDGSLYVSIGLNLYNGNGLSGPDWLPLQSARPGLPTLLSLAFSLFGVSIQSAFYATRIFYPLTIGVTYWLGSILGNRWSGLLAALFLVTSTSLNYWSTLVHLDHVMPFFMLLFLGLSYKGLQTNKTLYFLFAGICLGVGFLVKEVALLVFPVPWLAWLLANKFRNRGIFLRLILLTTILSLIVVGWLGYDALNTNDAQSSSLMAATTVAQSTVESTSSEVQGNDLNWIQVLGEALDKYYQQYLLPNFELAPLMLLGWTYIFLRCIWKGSNSDYFLCSLLFVLFAFAVMQGFIGQRERHGIILFQSSYLALAYALIRSFQDGYNLIASASNRRWYSTIWATIITTFIVVVIGYQSFSETVLAGTLEKFGKEYNTVAFMRRPDRALQWATTVNGEQAVADAGAWLQETIPSGAVLITDYTLYTDLFLYTKGQFPIHELTNPGVNWYLQQNSSDQLDADNNQQSVASYSPLFMWFRPNQNIDPTRRAMYMVSEEVWLQDLAESSVDYVIVSPTFNVFSLYFTHSPFFNKVAEFGNNSVAIYRVASAEASPTLLEPTTNVVAALKKLKKEHPQRYSHFADDFYDDYLEWDNVMLAAFLSGTGEQFRLGQSFTALDYFSMVSNLSTEELKHTIEFRENMLDSESSEWEYAILGGLHVIAGNDVLADQLLERSLAIYPDSSLVHQNMAEAMIAFLKSSQSIVGIEELKLEYAQAFEMHPNLKLVHHELIQAINLFAQDEQAAKEFQDIFEAHYFQKISSETDNIEHFLNLASLYKELGLYDSSRKYYLDAINKFGSRAEPYAELANLYAQIGEFDLAVDAYEQALLIQPEEVDYYDELGTLYQKTGRVHEAIEIYTLAMSYFPESAWPHLATGKLILSEMD